VVIRAAAVIPGAAISVEATQVEDTRVSVVIPAGTGIPAKLKNRV